MIHKSFSLASIWIIGLAASMCPLQAQWKALGPFGGSVNVVQVDPANPDSVLAATANASLFRSRDAGETWTALPFPAEFRATLHAALIDPVHPDTYLVALSSGAPQCAGVFRSRDGGRNWQQLPDIRNHQVWSLAMWHSDPRVIAAGTEDGIFLSTDSGDSWQRISPPGDPDLRPVVSLAFDPNDRRIIYAGTPHLPWKTEDGGRNWQPVHDGIETDSDVFSLQVDWKDAGRVVAGACSGTYRSTDGGTKWAKLKDATDRTYVVTQHPTEPGVWFAGTKSGLMKSTNGGNSWSKVLQHSTQSIAWDRAHPARMFVATEDAGVLRSDDGGQHWREINRGLCSRRLLPLVESQGALFSSTLGEQAEGGVWKLPPSAWNWVPSPTGGTPAKGSSQASAGTGTDAPVYVVDGGRLAVSRDGGRSWTLVKTPTPLTAAVAAVNRLYVAAAGGLFGSDDGGQTWKALGLPGKTEPIRKLFPLLGGGVAAVAGPRVWTSFDGSHWKRASLISGGPNILDVAGDASGRLLAATTTGLAQSDDFGATWDQARGIPTGNTVQAVVRHPARADLYFAATFGQLYESSDGGSTWQALPSDSLDLGPITQLLVVPGDPDRLFAMTDTHGVFELDYPAPGGAGSVSSASRLKF